MCGRYGLFAELNKLAEELGFPPHPARSGYRPSWNIAPSASILVVSAPTSVRGRDDALGDVSRRTQPAVFKTAVQRAWRDAEQVSDVPVRVRESSVSHTY